MAPGKEAPHPGDPKTEIRSMARDILVVIMEDAGTFLSKTNSGTDDALGHKHETCPPPPPAC